MVSHYATRSPNHDKLKEFYIAAGGFDGRGNYTLGLKEHTIFPEMVDTGNPAADVGMDITFVTSARDNKQARELLTILGMPFAGK